MERHYPLVWRQIRYHQRFSLADPREDVTVQLYRNRYEGASGRILGGAVIDSGTVAASTTMIGKGS
jgi:hypothetical protein